MRQSSNSLLCLAGLLCVQGAPLTLAEPTVFTGMCDASAAVAIDAGRFIVANDEDNILRVYARGGGAPLSEFDVSEFLGAQGKKKAKEKKTTGIGWFVYTRVSACYALIATILLIVIVDIPVVVFSLV